MQEPEERGRVLPLLHRAAARLPEESSTQAEEPHPPGEALVPTGMAVPSGQRAKEEEEEEEGKGESEDRRGGREVWREGRSRERCGEEPG